MKVGDLVEKLTMYAEDTLIVVDGYEEGFADNIQVKRLRVVLNKHGEDGDSSVYAPHGRIDKYGGDKGKPQETVVFIGEGRHLEGGF